MSQDTVYSSNQLSKWFAIASLVLLLITIWALIEDYDRPWKGYQRQARKIATAVGESRLKKANMSIDKSKLAGLEKELEEAQKDQTVVAGEMDNKIKQLNDDYFQKNVKFQNLKGELSADLFQLEKAIEKESPTAPELKADWDAKSKKVDKLKVIVDEAESKLNKAKDMKVDILANAAGIEAKRDRLTKEITLMRKQISENEADIGNIIRNAPVVDFIAPTIKINQVILPELKDDYFFNKVARVDRCMTCHVTIDKAGFEDYPEPFRTHPKLKLMVGPESPHPANKIGCTTCHGGVPQSVDFVKAAHVPHDNDQANEWLEKYHFHADHNIKTHMLPITMTEGKCLQCHASQVELDGAPVFNAGMRLIERYGCYNCHKIAGHFDRLAQEKKSGPQLLTVSSKLSEEWVKKWLWEPRSFRPTTLMPSFWQVHNNSDPDSLARGKVEIDAIVHYLFKKATPFEPLKLASSSVGDAAHGKELVGQIGCLGCHAVGDFPRKNPDSPTDIGWKNPIVPLPGPELNQMGSKVSKEWLESWLSNPRHYWEQTSMPSLKLSDTEIHDIAEYLLSKKNESFEQLPVPEPDEKVRNQVVTDYLQKTMAPKDAAVKLASMSLDDRQNYLGEKLISHYGCYACHAIKGFENAPKVGVELTNEGSKDVSKFAFDNVHLDHNSRPSWIYTKIRTPRIWDVGKLRDFEAKTKMPDFKMSHEQAQTVASIILGQENKNVEDAAIFKVDGRWEEIIEGHRVINRYNCVGCHAIEGKQGHVLAFYKDDIEKGPPRLNTEGAKVQTGWLHSYLLNPSVMIRPFVKIRMPLFRLTDTEVTTLTKYFAAFDKAPYPFMKKDNGLLTSDEVAQANKLFNSVACLSCHGTNVEPSAGAPNLKNVKARLRPDWVARWITDPQAILPGTRMPQLWPPNDPDDPKSGNVAVPGYFGDKADVQIQKIRDFVFQYGGQPELPPPPIHNPY